jgi:hypothetical protein
MLTLCCSPPEALIFSLAVLRVNQGTHLLGYAEISMEEALAFGEQKKRTFGNSGTTVVSH